MTKTALFTILLATFINQNIYGGDEHAKKSNADVRFTENKNQWEREILYRAQLDAGVMFLERNGFTYNFYDEDVLNENHARKENTGYLKIPQHAFRMTFVNSLKTTQIEAKNPAPDYCNYFIGNDKSRWAGNVKNYQGLKYKSLYPDVDLEIEGLQNSLKYNFIVAPFGNTDNIKMQYEGLDNIALHNGGLRFKTRINEWVEHSPYAYQWIGNQKKDVPCEFVLKNNIVYFHFPQGYNKEFELVIDPLLIFSASSGSKADNFGHTCTYDAAGNLYSGGIAFSQGYPTKVGYDTTHNGMVDVVVTKYSADGKTLIYSTYIGGNSDEIITSMIVDSTNQLFFYGVTGSSNFPVDTNAYQKDFKGGIAYRPHINNGNYFPNGTDIFACKFSAAGNVLLASTYIGGRNNDGVNSNNNLLINGPLDSLQYNYGDYYRGEIDMDKAGNVYIVTSTRSDNFPVVNGFDNTLGGIQDAVVIKMDNNLKNIIWSTFLGGGNNDGAYALILDDTANVYVTGGTRSADFPITNGVIQPTNKGGVDGYVTKIKHDGSAILASTYWGTDKYDQSFFVQLDQKNDVYLFGQTEGKIPVMNCSYSNPNSSQFVTKLNNSLTTIGFSTVVGNGEVYPNICPTAFLVDLCGNIYVAGWAAGFKKGKGSGGMDIPLKNMPITTGTIDGTTTGFDFYMMVLGAGANSLVYGMYWGGDISQEHVHGGTSRFDKKGIVYQSLCTGCGGNDDYPVQPAGTWPNTSDVNGSNCNNAVFKIDFQPKPVDAKFFVDSAKGCAPYKVKFVNQSTSWTDYLWDFGNGDTTSTILNPTHIFDLPGVYHVKLITKNKYCNTVDSTSITITVYPNITADFDFKNIPCTDSVQFFDSSMVAPFSWLWSFDDGTTSTVKNPLHVYPSPGIYNAQLIVKTVNGCTDTAVVTFDNRFSISVNSDTLICEGGSVQLKADGGLSYSWLPVAGLSNPNIPDPVASPTVTTSYTVHITLVNALGDTCVKTLSTTVNVLNSNSILLDASVEKDTLLKGESTILHAVTTPGLSVQWTPTTGVKDPSALNTQVTPLNTTTYTVTITGSTGCSKSDTVTIYIVPNECEDEDVFVPNTFTPNGDGENDVLYVRSNNLTSLYFAVYNRWGELVFETTDLDKGWDGMYKGMKADPAVFAWYVKGRCFNGKEFFKKGNVTLIR